MAEIVKKDKTVGQVAAELQQRPDDGMLLGDIEKQESDRYLEHLHAAIGRGKKRFSSDFFVEVSLKKEKLLVNVLPRIFAFERRTCPTPFYSQDVYKYDSESHSIEYIWSVVSPQILADYKLNESKIEGPQLDLLFFGKAYEEGKLLEICKDLNSETKGSYHAENQKDKNKLLKELK